MSDINSTRVVLIRPKIAANIGAVARVMRNFGSDQLVLVQPETEVSDPRARRLATHSKEILDQARVVADLGEGVADCVLVIGTTARTGGLFRQQIGTPEEILAGTAETIRSWPTALVFGPERTGLTNEEIARCHFLISIPTYSAHPVLNLAQAVAVCLYELRRQVINPDAVGGEPSAKPATFQSQEYMFERLRLALEKIHFLYGDKADALMVALRQLISRAQPSQQEVEILLGLARQMEWFHDQEHKK